ncbi:hypothetical protein [Sutcliffiella horikoshii]|uniref:hypothetical protein n=1 Tax=Sutcliffiella horikoshii TaxID=79883 RepID=UPI001CBCB68D|nr:hypothetical protein [Sutcliffiella horikoshii]
MMKILKVIIPLLLIILLLAFLSGYRFTALSAAKSHAFLTKDAELMDQYEIGSTDVFLFKSDVEQEYRTVLTQKSGVFFSSRASMYIPYSTDEIQTVGGASFNYEKDAGSFISVVSNDEEVAYIEVGVEPNIERKEIKKGERISFLFPFSEQIDFLNPTAYDKDGNELYYHGYPRDTNVFKHEEFKWHKTGEQ